MTGSFSTELSAAGAAAAALPLPLWARAVPARSAGVSKLISRREYFMDVSLRISTSQDYTPVRSRQLADCRTARLATASALTGGAIGDGVSAARSLRRRRWRHS